MNKKTFLDSQIIGAQKWAHAGLELPNLCREQSYRRFPRQLALSGEDVLNRGILKRQLGVRSLEPRALRFKLLELRQRHTGVTALPLVTRRVADAVLTTDLCYCKS
jgi:hypothetical protein